MIPKKRTDDTDSEEERPVVPPSPPADTPVPPAPLVPPAPAAMPAPVPPATVPSPEVSSPVLPVEESPELHPADIDIGEVSDEEWDDEQVDSNQLDFGFGPAQPVNPQPYPVQPSPAIQVPEMFSHRGQGSFPSRPATRSSGYQPSSNLAPPRIAIEYQRGAASRAAKAKASTNENAPAKATQESNENPQTSEGSLRDEHASFFAEPVDVPTSAWLDSPTLLTNQQFADMATGDNLPAFAATSSFF